MKRLYLILAVLGLTVAISTSSAANTCTWTGATDTAWETAGNWSGCAATTPQAADTAVINSAANQPTVSSDQTITALTLNTGTTLTISSNTLTVNGAISLNANGSATTTISNAGTLTQTAGATTTNRPAGTGEANISLSGTGTWNLNDFTTVTSLTTTTLANGATYSIAGDITRTAGTLEPGTSTVAMTGTGRQLKGSNAHSYYNLTINSGASITNPSGGSIGNVTIAKDLTVAGTFTQDAARTTTFNFSGTSNLTGGGSITLGSVTVQGSTTLNAGSESFSVVGASFAVTGTFSGGTSTVTFNGAAAQTISGSGTRTFNNLTITNSNGVTLGGASTVNGTLTVTSGVFDQGASFALTAATISVASGATLRNLGTGPLTVGAGGVSNAGTIEYNSNGTPCGQADSILIRSSSTGTQRTWSGSGTFSMIDVNVQDQRTPVTPPPAAILVNSGTDAGNNIGWVFTGTCTSGTYTWIGGTLGANTDWQVATNWSPSRVTPATSDILIFDGNSTPSPLVTNIPTQTNAAIRLVNNNISATFNASAVAPPHTLTLSGATGTDLQVSSGTTLTLAGSNVLMISIASGSTASVNGQIIFQDAAHRLIGNAVSAVLFHTGSIFTTASGFAGNAFGTGSLGDGTTNSVQFESGSKYFHNAGLSPFGTAGLGPVAVFQTGSEADWLTPSGFQASGRTYANLVIGKGDPGGVAVKVTDSGGANFRFDNLAINHTGSADSELEFNGTGSSMVTIQGNIISVGSGTGSTLWDVNLTAPGGIVISEPSNGTITFGNSFSAAKGIRFESNSTLATGTTLNLARILQMGISPTNILTANGTIVPNFSGAQGYVVGGVRKTPVPGTYTFHVGTLPVGATSGYTPVDLANATGGGDLTVRPVDADQPSLDPAKSLDEYWKLTLNGGSLTTDVTFNYLQGDVSGNEALYRIIRVEGGSAVSFPNDCPSGSACVDTVNNKATIKGINSFSDWTLGEPAAPTVARLTRFNAASYSDGVELNWDTGFEVDNLGYHIYREENGRRTRVTPSVVAGSALTVGAGRRLTAGYSYSWFDPQGTRDSVYSLETIDLDGSSEWVGPIYPYAAPHGGKVRKAPKRAMLLEEIGADSGDSSSVRSWPAAMKGGTVSTNLRLTNGIEWQTEVGQSADRSAPSREGLDSRKWSGSKEAEAPLAVQEAIAACKAVKIQVRKSGWYRVTQAELVAAGFDPSSDARRLQLYVDGQEVPISLSTEGARLSANDTMEFYGVPLDTPTTDTRVYWLVSGSSSGMRMIARRGKLKPADPNTGLALGSFDLTTERRDRLVYVPSLLNGDEENIFGSSVRSNPVSKTLVLKNVDLASASQPSLEVALQGLTTGTHMVHLKVNGTNVGTMTFANTDHPVAKFSISPALLREGDNVVSLASMNGQSDISLIDWIRLTYPHQYVADNNSLVFTAPGGQPLKVQGFSSPNVRVVDVTDPNLPTQLSAYGASSGGAFEVRVQPAGPGVRTLIAFTEDQMAHPVSITANQPSSWNEGTNGADMVIIAHKNFRQAIEPLASLRRSQGLSVAVVDVEDIYDEFNYGAHTPAAIKSFLTTAASNWNRKPAYLLLVGDSSWDPRNYLSLGENDFVPTKLIDTESLETGSDDWFADFNNVGLANMAIGRLPARTVAEVNLMVSKILSYEQERELNAPLRGAVMVADRGFETLSSQTGALLPPNVTVQTINRADVGNDDLMRGQIVDALNQGPMIVNYYGHGSVRVWTGNGLLSSELAGALTNTNQLSLFVMMTCLNGYASDASIDSLGEAALKAPNGGAVAVWASSGFTTPQPQFEMGSEFYRLLFGAQPMRLGETIRSAKAATGDMDVRRTWILLGDPAMRMR